jgi:Predicted ornithine cyclodeaminase, mu-crystallin homolog
MLILSSKDIESIFDFKKAIEALKDAFVSYSKGEAMNPFRSTLKIDDENQFLFMPSYMKGIEKMSIKIVSYFSKNLRIGLPLIFGSVLLFDADLLATLEG